MSKGSSGRLTESVSDSCQNYDPVGSRPTDTALNKIMKRIYQATASAYSARIGGQF